ncbi:MFS transporter [Pseudomonas sp. PDM24]|uniref:MFS transporter n=1 Tax=Pseudomonas sp. PDM24 TaxID=2854777 RepID=UPI001C442126|nr:MFS transporter [Pseudomonas sp. PDM24]MBV7495084.1 MFS transporter [Pseudomonas sp. PDM24]
MYDTNAKNKRPEADTGRPWYVLFLLSCGYMVYTLDKQVISVLIEPIKAEFGISDTTISLLAGLASTAPFALACIPVGMLADRINRKNLLVTLIIAWSLMTGMAGLATSILLLILSRVGVGAFESGFSPLSLSILSDTFQRRRRATAMGLFALGSPAGAFLGLALGGYIAATHGWRAAFFIAGLPGLLLALLIAFTVREPRRGQYDPPEQLTGSVPLRQVLAHIWRDRALCNILMGMVFCAVVPAAITIWSPSFLIRVHGMDIRQAGLAASLAVGLCGAAGAAAGGFIADRLGRIEEWRKLISPVLGTLLSSVLAVLTFVVVSDAVAAVVCLALVAFFSQFFIGTGYGVTTTLCPPALRGTTLSILLMAFNFGSFGLGTLLLGMLSDHLKPWAGNTAIAYGMLGSVLFSILGSGFIARAMWHMRRANQQALVDGY